MRSVVLTSALVGFVPGTAFACPVCFESSGSGTLYGFYLSTILLTLMPFVLIAMVAFLAFADRRACDVLAPGGANGCGDGSKGASVTSGAHASRFGLSHQEGERYEA
jgi:hypothetical protein